MQTAFVVCLPSLQIESAHLLIHQYGRLRGQKKKWQVILKQIRAKSDYFKDTF